MRTGFGVGLGLPCALVLLHACGGDVVSPRDGGGSDSGARDGGEGDDGGVPVLDGGADSGPIVGRTFFIAPDGDDANDGSEAAPFLTFGHAIAGLLPGDTLIAKDGLYGRLGYDCENDACDGAPCPSGAPGAPITVRAENERRAALNDGTEYAMVVLGCSYVTIEGFEAYQSEDAAAPRVHTQALVVDADHVTMRRNVFHTPNRYENNHMVHVGGSDYFVFEENEIYDFHRGALVIGGSDFAIVRRNYINSRDVPNLTDGYNCCCLNTGDYGVIIGAAYRPLVENNVVERTCDSYRVDGHAYVSRVPVPRSGTGARLIGNIALSSRSFGYRLGSSCDSADPCGEERRVTDMEVVDCVSVDAPSGFIADGVERVVLRNVTSIDASSSDFRFTIGSDNEAVRDQASFTILNALDVGTAGTGYRFSGQAEGLVAYGSSFGNEDDFPDGMGFVDGVHGTSDPMLGGCTAYVPAASPMKGAGLDGDIGANIVMRTVDGRQTSEPLWDPATGAFPCGAVIPGGINDEAVHPDATCASVHARLGVGGSSCPLP